MFYWIKLKDGRLQTQQSRPKSRPHLSETSHAVNGDWQHYVHNFVIFNRDGVETGTYEMHTHCGYDRGPKLQNLVLKLIGGVS